MIAQTILMQLGSRRFVAFTGSKQLTDMGNGLRLNLARNKTSANRLDIIYDGGTDLYNLRFYRKTFSKKTFDQMATLSRRGKVTDMYIGPTAPR